MNVQIKEDKDDRVIKVNVNRVNKTNTETKKSDNNAKENEDYLDIESGKNNPNGNTDCKTIINNNISDIHKMNINKNLYNYKSTNYKFSKEEQKNLHKSNPVFNMNKQKESYNNMDFIELKHPLDNSSSEDENANKNQNQNTVNKENINVSNSMEERINNFKNNLNEINEHIEEDGVNMGNYRDEENDDMVNFGQSMTNDKINEAINEQKEICVIFEIQSTGERHYINTKKDIKFNDLVEIFKNKIDLSPFEKPEFMFNGVYLIDFDKPISEYNINDKSKINVYI